MLFDVAEPGAESAGFAPETTAVSLLLDAPCELGWAGAGLPKMDTDCPGVDGCWAMMRDAMSVGRQRGISDLTTRSVVGVAREMRGKAQEQARRQNAERAKVEEYRRGMESRLPLTFNVRRTGASAFALVSRTCKIEEGAPCGGRWGRGRYPA